MKNKIFLLSLLLVTSLMMGACGSVLPALDSSSAQGNAPPAESAVETMPPDTGDEGMMDEGGSGEMMDAKGSDEMMEDESMGSSMEQPAQDEMMDSSMGQSEPGEMMEAPGWFSSALTNAATGEQFTVADLKGKVVLVETLAMWCSNCLKQQKQVQQLHSLLGARDDFISLGLDIDPNELQGDLSNYIQKHGFDWIYAIAPREVIREIGSLYGDQFLNPPSTPMLIIDRHGEAHPLPFGIKDAASLQEALQPFLDGQM